MCAVLATSGALAAAVGTGGAAAAAVPAAPAVCGGIAAGAGILGAALAEEEEKGPSMEDVFNSVDDGFHMVAAGIDSVHGHLDDIETSLKKGFKQLSGRVGKVQDTLNQDRNRRWDDLLDQVETWYDLYIVQEMFRSDDLKLQALSEMESKLDGGDFEN